MTKQELIKELITIYQSKMTLRELHGLHPIDFKTWLRISGYGMIFVDYPNGQYTATF